MTDPHLFWTIFSAVLAAIMLGGTFFWGLIAYSRHERDGTAGGRESNGWMVAILMPMAFLICALLIAFDRTSFWDSLLQ